MCAKQEMSRWCVLLIVAGTLLATAGPTTAADVTFADANLEAAVRTALGISAPTPITDTDMQRLGSLEVRVAHVASIQGLEYSTNLTHLDLGGNYIIDISPVSGLTKLSYLRLDWNRISDISAASGLTNLHYLNLHHNQIGDISAVSGLTNLTGLTLSSNQIGDISAASGLTNLTDLALYDNQIQTMDLSNADLRSLQWFGVWGNPLTNVLLTDATLNQTGFNVLMDGGATSSSYIGLGELAGVFDLDMSGVDFTAISDLSTMHTMDDLEELLLAGAANLDGGQVVTLTGELDSLNWLDVTGPWDSFDAGEQASLNSWDAVAGNTLVVPEPATLGLLCVGALAVIRRRRR